MRQNDLKSLQSILSIFQRIDPEFPLQYAVCLLEIGRDEGLSLTMLARRTGMPLSTVSRIAAALSSCRKNGKTYGLIKTMTAPEERRRKQLLLTPQGHRILNGLIDSLVASR